MNSRSAYSSLAGRVPRLRAFNHTIACVWASLRNHNFARGRYPAPRAFFYSNRRGYCAFLRRVLSGLAAVADKTARPARRFLMGVLMLVALQVSGVLS